MYDDFLKQIGDFIFMNDEPERSDIIFIPGNGYPQMAEKAATLFKAGYADYILPSGKYSITNGKFTEVLHKKEVYNKEYSTEWEFLQDVLLKNNVPEQVILREDMATYTYENALKSKEITDAMGLRIKKAIICCKTHHARRSFMYYQKVFPETKFYMVASDVDGIAKENWTQSEESVETVMGEVQRLIKQFSVLMKDK